MEFVKLLAPAVAITATSVVTSSTCGNLDEAGKDVEIRPPGLVFAVVWPILYATTGWAWKHSNPNFDAVYVLLIGLLCLWLVLYSCTSIRELAFATILMSVVVSFFLSLHSNKLNFLLTAWLVFASTLAAIDISKKK